MKHAIGFIFLTLLIAACNSDSPENLQILPTYTSSGTLQAVIEIPAGTNHKIEYNKETLAFENDKIDGKDRIVNFLPYPGNYGFIPSTFMDPSSGGDDDAVDILVISESIPTGTVLEVIPIALFRMHDRGELDVKVIAIPADEKLQSFKAADYESFNTEFAKAKLIVEFWFLNYKGKGQVDNIHWQDVKSAKREINRWVVKK